MQQGVLQLRLTTHGHRLFVCAADAAWYSHCLIHSRHCSVTIFQNHLRTFIILGHFMKLSINSCRKRCQIDA